MLPRIRLRHVGTAAAANVSVVLTTDDPDVTVVAGAVDHSAWDAGRARNNVGFALDIAPDALPHDVRLSVSVASAAGESRYFATFPIVAPAVEFVALDRRILDVGNRANKDGVADAGETIRPRIGLTQIGSHTAVNVRVTMVIDDPDVTVTTGQVFHETWPAGERRDNEDLRLVISPAATPHDLRIVLSVTADNGGPWQFGYVIPVSRTADIRAFAMDLADVERDGDRDFDADAGDRIDVILRVANFGPSDAEDIHIALETADVDVTIVSGEAVLSSLASWKNTFVTGFVLDVGRGGAERDVTLVVRARVGDQVTTSTVAFHVTVPPIDLQYISDWIWDPAPRANNDKVANPGETILPRVRLTNASVASAQNVRATLLIDDTDIEVTSGLVTHDTWPGGVGRNNHGFVVDVSPAASAHDVAAIVSVTADNGGPWQFSFTIPIVDRPPEIEQRSYWIWDPAPGGNLDRLANPGERLQWRVRLRNAGGAAQNAQVSIVINDDDVAIVDGVMTHDTWLVGEARNHSFVLEISPTATAHEVSATVSVTADNGGPWQFDVSMPIIVPFIAETALLANYPNPFNPETWIPFDLSAAAEVTVRIYDTVGRPIRRLNLGWLPAGSYRRRTTAAYWDGRNEVGEAASSGVYVYGLRAGAHREIRRMIVQK
ncbi:hypothetical protein CMK11_06925 [Candidatus Poribacteria bacterium]|nr:hypothetical protein [Candidatus Poribacteria bacterium]